MNWFQLIAALLPVISEIISAVSQALAAGKSTQVIHQQILDHAAELPAKIRE